MKLKIKTLVIGPIEVNNYLVIDENTKDAVLIDAGGDLEKTIKLAKANNANIKLILNTHGHFDHTAGDYDLREKTGAKVLIHESDQYFVNNIKDHLALYNMPQYEVPVIDEYIKDEQIINAGSIEIKVIHTPGHSEGSVCFLIDKQLFSGDTLFAGEVGRTDLPGGSFQKLKDSVTNKLFTLDGSIKVYPGHGPSTSIEYEKINNPYFGEKGRYKSD